MEICPKCEKGNIAPGVGVFSSSLFPERCDNCDTEYGIKGFAVGSYSAILEFGLLSLPIVSTKDNSVLLLVFVAIFALLSIVFGSQREPKIITPVNKIAARLTVGITYFFFVLFIFKYQL